MCHHPQPDPQHRPGQPARSIRIAGTDWPVVDRPLLPEWIETARSKGFELIARIGDRFHLAARCTRCGALNRIKIFTLRSAAPICQGCLRGRQVATAAAAGLVFLRRDPGHTPYACYRAPCGHEVRRQFGAVERIAGGRHGLRCDICHHQRECDEAASRGWQLLGPDPEGDANYRLYRHDCGHAQRVARANMQTGRFGCGACGESWPAAPSFLCLMRFALPGGERVMKLGFARDPESRLRHQLLRDKSIAAELLRTIPIETGQQACRIEKRLHARLRRQFPEAVVPAERFADLLSVRTEIYGEQLCGHLHACLAGIATSGAAGS